MPNLRNNVVALTDVRDWKGKLTLELECQKHCEAAVNALVDIMQDEAKPASQRIKAAAQILDRGYGKPVERTVIANLGDSGDSGQYSNMSTRDLLTMMANRLGQGRVIDAKPETDCVNGETTPPIDFENEGGE